MDLIRMNVTDLQTVLHLLTSDVLDFSIEGANFDITYNVCEQHFLVVESTRGKKIQCTNFFLRVVNFYCLKNVLSCRNTIPDDSVYLQKKHAKVIYCFLHTYLQENPNTSLRYEIIHIKTYIAMLTG